jgi:hypothetical protein
VWLLLTWADGSRDRIEEDYAPRSLVGHLVWKTSAGARDFTAEWLHGEDAHWSGPPLAFWVTWPVTGPSDVGIRAWSSGW